VTITLISGSTTSSAVAGAAKKSGPNARKAAEIIRSPFLVVLVFSKVLISLPGVVLYCHSKIATSLRILQLTCPRLDEPMQLPNMSRPILLYMI
jgi:hypothetical protein